MKNQMDKGRKIMYVGFQVNHEIISKLNICIGNSMACNGVWQKFIESGTYCMALEIRLIASNAYGSRPKRCWAC